MGYQSNYSHGEIIHCKQEQQYKKYNILCTKIENIHEWWNNINRLSGLDMDGGEMVNVKYFHVIHPGNYHNIRIGSYAWDDW